MNRDRFPGREGGYFISASVGLLLLRPTETRGPALRSPDHSPVPACALIHLEMAT